MCILILDFEEAAVPNVLYIWLGKKEGVLRCTQNKKIPDMQNGLSQVHVMHPTKHILHFKQRL